MSFIFFHALLLFIFHFLLPTMHLAYSFFPFHQTIILCFQALCLWAWDMGVAFAMSSDLVWPLTARRAGGYYSLSALDIPTKAACFQLDGQGGHSFLLMMIVCVCVMCVCVCDGQAGHLLPIVVILPNLWHYYYYYIIILLVVGCLLFHFSFSKTNIFNICVPVSFCAWVTILFFPSS